MSEHAPNEARRWLVSARTRGELLTSSARGEGVDLLMVGVPTGYSSEEVESWLRDLMGMALETSRTETGELPIPALLHHLLTGLLFSHQELWEREGAHSPSTLAFVRAGDQVAFGWVNGKPPELWLDDRPAPVEFVRIRDSEGREAHALAIDHSHRVRVHFAFEPGATVDAAWVPESQGSEAEPPPVPAASRATSTIARAVGARAGVPEATSGAREMAPAARSGSPAPPAPRGGEGWTVVYEGPAGDEPPPPPDSSPPPGGWWSNVVSWVSGKDEVPATGPARDPAAGATGMPEQVPPTPEAAELTERTAPIVNAGEANATLAEIELAPLAPADPAGSAPATPAPAPELQLESARLEPAPVRRRPAGAPRRPAAPDGTPPGEARPTRPPAARPTPAPQASAAPAEAPPRPAAPPAPVPAPARPVEVAAVPDFIEPDLGPRRAAPDGADGDRVPRRLRWEEPERRGGPPLPWKILAPTGGVILLLFLAGWLLGGSAEHGPGESNPVARALRAVGLGGARFEASITSHPPGAWITVDGRDVARRTPARVELAPGTHEIVLSFEDMGSASFEVRGVRGEKVTLDAPLWGSLEVYAGDASIPVAVSVNGESRGVAPLTVEQLKPGTHEVRFSGPGLQPWGQTVQVKVKERTQLLARAVTSPATGILEVRSLWTDAEGSEALTGATVYVDGERKGVTPLTLELPRGPHSVRVESRGENSPVQVIDLPGGNQRFANFELGLGIDQPTLEVLGTPIRVPEDQPLVISAALQGVHAVEAREMWLHVRQPDGAWRRSAMSMMKAPGGIVGTVVFPSTFLDAQGRTSFYVSAANQTGDEYFSEVLTATSTGTGARR